MIQTSIFKKYFTENKFVDKFIKNKEAGVDVIIPVIHTNELWEANLYSIYREIPVNRLLIGDGGCIDDTIEIAKKFPRVYVFNHKKYKTLGFSIRRLIEQVKTDWFIYLHSDVYLPDGWFETMKKYKPQFDWYGCEMVNTILVEYPNPNNITKLRPFAGSQMGRKAAFKKNLGNIDDDFVYRQEDFVFASLIEQAGFKQGFVSDTFHYHQTMYKPSKWERKIKGVSVEVEMDRKEELRTHLMQAKGFIKYLEPNPYYIAWVSSEIASLQDLGKLDWKEFKNWVRKTNSAWLPHIKFWKIQLIRIWQREEKMTKLRGLLQSLFFGRFE